MIKPSIVWLAFAGRGVIIAGFFCATHVLFTVHISGWEHDHKRRHTYYAMLHKRDTDPFFILPALFAHRGWRSFARSEVHFGLRGDAFAPGFLARMASKPRVLARMLYPLNVGPILRALGVGVHPLTSFFARPAEAWLRDAQAEFADTPLGDVLATDFVLALAQAAHIAPEALAQQPLRVLLEWRYQPFLQNYMGAEIFAAATRRTMERATIAAIKQQYQEIGAVFREDASLLGAPEGELSPDGHIGAVRGGFWRIVRAAPDDLCVVPIAIIYDYATTKRPRVFINVTPSIDDAHGMSPAELQLALRRAWLRHATLTGTQLGSAFLVQQRARTESRFTDATFEHFIAEQAEQMVASGHRVDPALLQARRRRRRARDFLRYTQKRGAVRRIDAYTWEIGHLETDLRVMPGEVGYEQQPFAYAWHEYQDMAGEPSIPVAAEAIPVQVVAHQW